MDPLKPKPELVRKLALIVARADAYVSPHGAMSDLAMLEQLLLDPEVREWLGAGGMNAKPRSLL